MVVLCRVARPCDPTPCDPTPCDPTPCDPTPCDPTPCDPTPCDPTPCDPTCDPTPFSIRNMACIWLGMITNVSQNNSARISNEIFHS
ncbi:MAG: hypothetical protein EAY81_00235 [Bacteroidetes bacterium]|nr:MAG: hypothetical protein EAY81_00235 [Bacteroidota bacterium]